ncbi:hypothetical protein BASA81_015839 [Batrachochytrium salamandrivorans]|nr:hypothetical protein BASA81_015839 [Batrachochytrium salamandrivorans]
MWSTVNPPTANGRRCRCCRKKRAASALRRMSSASTPPPPVTTTTAAAIAADNYKFKFLFANHDGVFVELDFPARTTGLEIKQSLLNEHWPGGDRVEKPTSTGAIRLLCMGRMLEDSKSLHDSKLPRFEHATPMNISLMPKAKGTYSESNPSNGVGVGGKKPEVDAAANNAASGRMATTTTGPNQNACCTVS